MDFDVCDVIFGGQVCAHCHLSSDEPEGSGVSCFDTCPDAQSGPGRFVCRTGIAALYSPVLWNDNPVAHVVLSGFVTSTRERRGVYERLLSRGVSEESARRRVKGLPVISRRQADSYLQLALSSARVIVDATVDRLASRERIDELKLFVTTGNKVVSSEHLDADTLGAITEEAVSIARGEAGALLRPRGAVLEVVARTAQWRGSVGALVPFASTAAGRAAETNRTVLSTGRDGKSSTLAMPLSVGEHVLGVLEVRLPPTSTPVPNERLSRLGRFTQFIGIAFEREDERSAVTSAMSGYAQLNELASDLGAQTDSNGVVERVMASLGDSFTFDIGGLVLTGWGMDRAEVAIAPKVGQHEVDSILELVSGRNVDDDPFGDVRLRDLSRPDIEKGAFADERATANAALHYGSLTIGWLFVARSDGGRFGAQDNALLDGIAAHAGAAFGRAALFARIRDDYAKTIAALSATLDMGERTSSGHAARVMDYAMMIGTELGLDRESVEQLRFAGLLHDIGKAGIATEILLKPSKLTAEELAAVQRHAQIGASIVEQIEFLKSLTPVILHHHERWDGRGYPHGLIGEDIPLLARILSVADAFDAMTTEHAFRKRLAPQLARLELEGATGTQFDPRVVAAFLIVLDRMALAGGTGLLAPIEARGHSDLPA
jgi:putative nucleotidyltransferase with HDIG domain